MATGARNGIITFGLVSIPVALHVAARTTPLDVVHFVDADAVDPIYLERSYYVGPQRDTEHAYGVLLTAMRNTRTAAVVAFVMSRRQQYALLRPDADKLVLHTLYYGDEVREFEVDRNATKAREREVEFAEQYIKALRQPFKPEAYHDQYRETLLRIIRAKAEGEAVELEPARKPPAKVSNLMDALRQSVAAVRKPPAKIAGAERERRGAARRSRRQTAAGQRPRRKAA
jgi:DNA end-binding protein Ku